MCAPAIIELMKAASTWMSCPVIQRAPGDPRRNHRRNVVDGRVPTGVARHMSRTSLPIVCSKSERMGVSPVPGLTVLPRTPYLVQAGPARRLQYRITACLDVLYTG